MENPSNPSAQSPNRPLIVTIDGPGGAGKSTVCSLLARRLGLPCLNSGYLYRAVTLLVLEDGADFEDITRVEAIIRGMDLQFRDIAESTRVFIGDRDITSRLKDPDVTPLVHRIANNPTYRALLVDIQRRCVGPRGLVAEGRDMGTVIFPEAPCKFYLDASPEVRARRQQKDLEAKGYCRGFEEILQEVLRRDRHDRERSDAPLRVPEGAEVIWTDNLSVEEVVERMLQAIRAAGFCTASDRVSGDPGRDEPGGSRKPGAQWGLGRGFAYALSQFLVRICYILFFRIRTFGLERVPESGAAILASNHQSFLDPLTVGVGPDRALCFLARDSLFRIPFLGWLIRRYHAFPIPREKLGARGWIEHCVRILEKGRALVFFPEGTRTPDGCLQPLRRGIGLLAGRSGAPVVPALIVGGYQTWPRGTALPRPGKIHVHFGFPVESEKLACAGRLEARESWNSLVEALESAHRRLAAEVRAFELLGEAPVPETAKAGSGEFPQAPVVEIEP